MTSTSRRDVLFSAAGLSALAAATRIGESQAQGASDSKTTLVKSPHQMYSDGTYAQVELAKPAWTLGVVQSQIHAIDADNHKVELQKNLDHMLKLIDSSFYFSAMGRPDVLFFHEFPLSGWKKWTRKEILKFAIEIPGPQTQAIGRKAKEYGCYIVFGAYAQDKAWPNHVLSITTTIGPDGNVVDKHWKARNIKGVFSGFELFTTTIYDVFDQYVEMYGLDAVLPVMRTPLGNIATSSVQREPELFRALAMKGAEIILRTASGGFTPLDIAATSLYNSVYTAVVNNAASPGNYPFFEDSGGGGSAIYGTDGKVIAEADGKFEQLVAARIPIAELRARHRQPIVHMELFAPIFAQYRSKFPPNLFSAYQPKDLEDASNYVRDKSRWK
jgi:predicted amidohydrolase